MFDKVRLHDERDPQKILETVFGYQCFRGLQKQAIDLVMQNQDVLLLMPTGGGKSICYQIPALCRSGMGLVISPLIALMDDQVAALRQLGISAGALHSELENEEAYNIRHDIASKKLKLLYVSPERLLHNDTLKFLEKIQISMIAIDEAHCISVWGHDFRPEYRLLCDLPRIFPSVPRIALTATADPVTQKDIIQALDMPEAKILRSSFHRSNLFIRVIQKNTESKQLRELLKKYRDAACIVYCGSRNKSERIAHNLVRYGFTALAYHAGLSALEKRGILLRFRSGEPLIIVATVAFGMGIDRPDVRLVVHLDMPRGPEDYYQQIGRAGRDGDLAETVLFYNGADVAKARYFLEHSTITDEQKKIACSRLDMMVALSETAECRTKLLLHCFGENLDKSCNHCDNCKNPVRLLNGTIAAQKVISAVYRTGQRFGAMHIINVLRGKYNIQVENFQHDRLSLFGIGKDKSHNFWRSVIHQLMARDVLRQGEEFSNLFLNQEKARPLLRGKKSLFLREDIEKSEIYKCQNTDDTLLITQNRHKLFDELKKWRSDEARKQQVPPYIIFHDSVLREVALCNPQTLKNFKDIKGVGNMKLEHYGLKLLEIIKEFQNNR